MTDKELHRLSRAELLELLTSLSEENESLRRQLDQQAEQLNSRSLQLQDAGSIAEAALRLSGVFASAQDAADRYLENIRQLSESAQRDADALIGEARRKCSAMEAEAQRNVDNQWDTLKERLDRYVEAHRELKDQLGALCIGREKTDEESRV